MTLRAPWIGRLLRFPPSRIALGYIALAVLALALFAVPLWHAWRENLSTFRAYVDAQEMQRVADVFEKEGAQGAAAAVASLARAVPRDQVMIFADASKLRLAGNLPAWPAGMPDAPGTYGLVVGLGGESSMRVVASHATLPGGYHLLMGRESVRFDSLVERFWYGIAAAMGIVLVLGAVMAWLNRNVRDQELQRQKAHLDELFDLAPDAVVLTELSPPRVLRVNREFTRMFGYTSEEAVGRSLRELIAPAELLEDYAQGAALIASGRKVDKEVVRRRKDGTRFPAHFTAAAIRSGEGKSAAYLVYRDITEMKRTQEELKRSEKRYALAMEAARDGHWDWIVETDEFYASPQLLEIYGFPADTVFAGRADFLARFPFHPEDKPKWEAAAAAHFAGKTVRFGMELRMLHQGEVRWIRLNGLCLRDAAGTLVRWTGSVRDVTESKRAEAALRESEARLKRSEERYALAMQAAQDAHWDWIVGSDEYYMSPRTLQVYGFPPDATFAGRSDFIARAPLHPEDRLKWDRAVAALFAGKGDRLSMELRLIGGGETRWLHLSGLCVRDAAGAPVRWSGSTRDVTERKRTLEALKLSQERYALAMEAAGDGHSDWNMVTDEFYASPRLVEMCGLPAGTTFKGRADWLDKFPFHAEDRPAWERAVKAHLAGETARFNMEMRYLPKGETRWVSLTGLCTRDASGKAVRWSGSLTDVTDRKRAELALRKSEERYALAMEAAGDGHSDWIFDTGEFYVSPRLLEICGYAPGTRFSDRAEWVRRFPFCPGERQKWEAALAAHLAGESARFELESRILVRGETRWIRFTFLSSRDASGKPTRWTGSTADITDRKHAEAALREFEKQLRQAQRLEAVGTLASGIAHDFNNILGAILGYGEMALRDAARGSRLKRDLDAVMVAGERGRALVDRILAFSRSGMVERVAVHVEPIVREVLDQLAGKLPPGITIESQLHAGRAAILGDPTQVHQVLMNLATNSVQAMESGGVLRVSLEAVRFDESRPATTGLVAAGDCLVLTVADSGVGIPSEISERIFDPFFTTKEAGVGTGLGLSLVHGIVTELGGAVDVRSAPGSGSTFTVYLPRSGEAPHDEGRAKPPMPHGNRQRVLIVDDEESLVALATRTLEGLGYVAVGFTSSSAALEAFRAHPENFDALITDERMPGMSGSTLIREVRGIRRAIPILLASGYVGRGVASRAYNSGADEVLKKPLLERDLAASLARVLHP